jgi:Amt family ammonium transporter
VTSNKRLTLSEKGVRLSVRLRDPEWRRYGLLLFTGKMMGAGLLLVLLLGLTNLPRLAGVPAPAPREGNRMAKQAANEGPRPALAPSAGPSR